MSERQTEKVRDDIHHILVDFWMKEGEMRRTGVRAGQPSGPGGCRSPPRSGRPVNAGMTIDATPMTNVHHPCHPKDHA